MRLGRRQARIRIIVVHAERLVTLRRLNGRHHAVQEREAVGRVRVVVRHEVDELEADDSIAVREGRAGGRHLGDGRGGPAVEVQDYVPCLGYVRWEVNGEGEEETGERYSGGWQAVGVGVVDEYSHGGF